MALQDCRIEIDVTPDWWALHPPLEAITLAIASALRLSACHTVTASQQRLVVSIPVPAYAGQELTSTALAEKRLEILAAIKASASGVLV